MDAIDRAILAVVTREGRIWSTRSSTSTFPPARTWPPSSCPVANAFLTDPKGAPFGRCLSDMRVTQKGPVTIPLEVRQALGIEPP